MSTASEEIKARYSKIERESDALGRIIGVKKLRPAQQLRIAEMIAVSDEGCRATFMIAASVCELDNLPLLFPRNRGELDSVLDILDREGMDAASKATAKLHGFQEENAETTSVETLVEEAKK